MGLSKERIQKETDGGGARSASDEMDVVVSAIPEEALYGSGLVDRPKVPGQLPRIGDYELHGEIGRGGMGVVFLARDVLEQEEGYVALKTVRLDLAKTEAASHFSREIQTLQHLDHSFIVPVLDVSHPSEATPFIVMPYFKRGNIAQLIKVHGRLPVRTFVRFAWQAATAIQHAHKLGIKHGDIKPANLLMTDDGESVCISDFGLARDFSTNYSAGGSLKRSRGGTPQYMSPQMINGKEEAFAADIYSFGATMYEMLAGQPPYVSEEADADAWRADIVRQVRRGMPRPISELRPDASRRLIEIVERAMARDLEKRYAGMDSIVHDLSKTDPTRSIPRLLRRRWLPVAAGILVLASIVSILSSVTESETRGVETVKVDESRPTVVLAWREAQSDPEVLHAFPPSAQRVVVDKLTLRNAGTQAIVAAVRVPVEGHNVFLFNDKGEELNRWDVSSSRRWRDCGPPKAWKVAAIATANLDGEDGDEIVVVASDAYEYPSRVTILDPRTGGILSTFWHLGQLNGLQVVDGFFGPDHPALVVTGANNKLDGFNAAGTEYASRPYKVRAAEDAPRTSFGRVRALMVLDPWKMDGVGPPRVPETEDLQGANPYAYAFLNAPSNKSVYIPDGGTDPVMPPAQQVVTIGCVERVLADVENGAPWFNVCADRRADEPPGGWQGAILQVDRDLVLRNVILADAGADPTTAAHWHQVWTPVIRNHRYIGD
ncbi:MAG: serine/threonine protein kinase [Phycisphaerae bacterium]|nr:serine/threonine protein kinase [Phycisphaerae bacterium]